LVRAFFLLLSKKYYVARVTAMGAHDPGCEFRLFNACGIPVYCHFFLVVYFAWQLSNALAGEKPHNGELPNFHKVGLITLSCLLGFFALFGTVLVHELGHCAGAKLVGGKVQKILLWPLGGLAFCGSGGGPAKDLVVTLAGPLTHLPMYFAWRALHEAFLRSSDSFGIFGPPFVQLAATGMQLQIGLAAFNLLVPVYPLDCSRALQAICELCGMPAAYAATVICLISVLFIGLLLASMLSLVHVPIIGMGYSPIGLMIMLWAGWQTYQLFQHVAKHTLRQHPLFSHCESTNDENLPLQSGRAG